MSLRSTHMGLVVRLHVGGVEVPDCRLRGGCDHQSSAADHRSCRDLF